MSFGSLIDQCPVFLGGHVPVGIGQRGAHVEAPRLPGVGPVELDAEWAVADGRLAADRAHLPVVPPGTSLDDLYLRIDRPDLPGVFERDRAVGDWIVDLGNDLMDLRG